MGLSPNGNMPGSDIFLGWVDKEGKPVLSDRHAPVAGTPVEDAQQDLVLEAHAHNGTHLTMQFARALATCDADDRDIEGDTMRVLYAYGDARPETSSSFNSAFKHAFEDRGSRAIFFNELNTPTEDNPNAHDPREWKLDIISHNVSLPEDSDTLYWCHIKRLPVMPKQHLIRYEPLIEESSLPFVHHFILYSCAKDMSEWEDKEEACFDSKQTHFSAMYECTSKYLAGWAVGGTHHIFPKDVGYPMFEVGSDKFVMLEVHYDNSKRATNVVDSSGIRLWLTPDLRKIEAGTTMIGIPVAPIMQIIPPLTKNFTNYAICTADCTADLPAGGVNVFSGFLHTHLLGRRVKLRQIRAGVEMAPLFKDDNYDFNFQEPRMKAESVKMMPGDEFILECQMSSAGRSANTFSGYSTQDEMCLIFVEYYPRTDYQLHSCFSTYEPEEALRVLGARNATFGSRVQDAGGDWVNVQKFVADDVRWAEADTIPRWQKAVRDGTHVNFCSSTRSTNISLPETPSKLSNLRGVSVVERDAEATAALAARFSAENKHESKEFFHKGLPTVRVPYEAPPPPCAGQGGSASVGGLPAALLCLLGAALFTYS